MNRELRSPLGARVAELTYAGEIRFGPRYFELAFNGQRLENRVFGDAGDWSQDGRYFAGQEWLSTQEEAGPQTRIVVFDLARGLEFVGPLCTGGFATPAGFDERALSLKCIRHGSSGPATIEFRLDLNEVDGWRPFSTTAPN